MQNNEDVVEVCWSCGGLKECWCNNKQYVKMWRFVYELMKRCKPTI